MEIILTDNQIKILKKISKDKYTLPENWHLNDDLSQLVQYDYINYWDNSPNYQKNKPKLAQNGKLIVDIHNRNRKQDYRNWLHTIVAIAALIVSIIALVLSL